MFDKIFNRKYLKVLNKIDREIEFLVNEEQRYIKLIKESDIDAYTVEMHLSWIRVLRDRKDSLVTLRTTLKQI